jgi:hypothetical protein
LSSSDSLLGWWDVFMAYGRGCGFGVFAEVSVWALSDFRETWSHGQRYMFSFLREGLAAWVGLFCLRSPGVMVAVSAGGLAP